MRYFDQDFPSIRLRLRKNDKNLSLILAKFCNKNGIKLIDSTYFPETNRYGDGKLLEKIEEEFENITQIIKDRTYKLLIEFNYIIIISKIFIQLHDFPLAKYIL